MAMEVLYIIRIVKTLTLVFELRKKTSLCVETGVSFHHRLLNLEIFFSSSQFTVREKFHTELKIVPTLIEVIDYFILKFAARRW